MRADAPKLRLPPEGAISAYSRKFYDGTYVWDERGFTDEHGVYREFDCYSEDARAPSPLPPMFDSDDEYEFGDEEGGVAEGGELSEELERELFGTPLRLDGPSQGGVEVSETLKEVEDTDAGAGDRAQKVVDAALTSKTLDVGSATKMLDGDDGFMLMSQDGTATVRKEDLFVGCEGREGLVARLEGIVLAYRFMGKDLSLEEGYELCGVPVPAPVPGAMLDGGKVMDSMKVEEEAGEEENVIQEKKMDQVTLDIPEKTKLEETQALHKEESSPSPKPTKRDDRCMSTDSSELSDVPSNLSELSPSYKAKKPTLCESVLRANILTTIQNTITPPAKNEKRQKLKEPKKKPESEEEDTPPHKTATRGVAQVRKSTRKGTATKSKTAKTTDLSPSLAALHSGSFRRSARQEAKLK